MFLSGIKMSIKLWYNSSKMIVWYTPGIPMHTFHALLLCCVCRFYPYLLGLFRLHWANPTIKKPCRILWIQPVKHLKLTWTTTKHTTTKHSTTTPCAYFMGYITWTQEALAFVTQIPGSEEWVWTGTEDILGELCEISSSSRKVCQTECTKYRWVNARKT